MKPNELFSSFLEFKPRESHQQSTNVPTSEFIKMGQGQAIKSFKIAAKQVPAYKDFLTKKEINPDSINNYEDFKRVPLTTKENYLKKYPLKQLLIDGNYSGKSAITSSSGSSGKPLYWPRNFQQDVGATKGFDSLLVNLFNIDKIRTLHINCSGMGVWTAGDYVTMIIKFLGYKYSNNSSISPGIDLENSLKVVNDLGKDFDQVIIYGYPPFIKDLIDETNEEIFDRTSFKIILYGESFTESLRKYLIDKVKSDDPIRTVSSVLGSSEGGVVGIEDANSIKLRQICHNNRQLSKRIFKKEQPPSVVQFNPMAKMIEEVDSEIVMTCLAGLPLIRYNTKDEGGILDIDEIDKSFKKEGLKLFSKILVNDEIPNTKLPFTYIAGRSDYVSTIYGVNISPENIKECLVQNKLSDYLSGKFVMQTKYDKKNDQYLEIICEAKNKVSLKKLSNKKIPEAITNKLSKISSEYGKLYKSMGERVSPKIIVRKYGDKKYFQSNNKQKYLIN